MSGRPFRNAHEPAGALEGIPTDAQRHRAVIHLHNCCCRLRAGRQRGSHQAAPDREVARGAVVHVHTQIGVYRHGQPGQIQRHNGRPVCRCHNPVPALARKGQRRL